MAEQQHMSKFLTHSLDVKLNASTNHARVTHRFSEHTVIIRRRGDAKTREPLV